MHGFLTNIEEKSLENENFRQVLYTSKNMQLVVMSIQPGEDIGEEIHDLDQFFRFEAGKGVVVMDGVRHEIEEGTALVVPAGTKHNIINVSEDTPLKLYTIYSPPNHKDGTIHERKADALSSEEHFDGVVSE